MASIVVLEKSSTSIALNVQDLSSSASSYQKANFYCSTTNKTITITSFYGSAPSVYSGRATFTGLSAGKSYTFSVRVYYSGGNSLIGEVTVTTSGSSSGGGSGGGTSKPSSWSWNTTEQNALYHNGAVSTITYARWNAFCDFVLQLTKWYYNTSSDLYNVAGAKMSSSSKTLTATKFNLVKNAIGSMNSTGIADVKKGDTVYGSYFITLSQKANGVSK